MRKLTPWLIGIGIGVVVVDAIGGSTTFSDWKQAA